MSEEGQNSIDVLVRRRGTIKAKVTNFEKYIFNLEKAYPEKKVSDRIVYLELETRYEKFSTVFDEFEQVQSEIEEICNLASLAKHHEERESFDNDYHNISARAKVFFRIDDVDCGVGIIGKSSGGPPLRTSHESVASVSVKSVVSQNTVASYNSGLSQGAVPNQSLVKSVKLPTIEIRTFLGDYSTWLEFRDTYVSLIHENDSLTEIQKFHYLRSFLGPQVLEVIASLGFSSTNYEGAWELICNRYNNSKILVQNHMRELFTLDRIHEESASVLRRLADTVDKHLRSLNDLNESTNNWDTPLIYLISTKLDSVTLRKWEHLKGNIKKPLLTDMTKFLRDRANLLETLEQSKPEKRSGFNFKGDSKNKQEHKKRVLLTANASCYYCKKNHFVQNCPDFLKLEVSKRIQEAKNKRLCLNCLRAGHILKNCYAPPCRICKSRHNSLLHLVQEKPVEAKEAQDMQGSLENVNCGFSAHKNEGVLLSTALVRVIDKNNKSFVARALLDPGSQSCFLTESFVNQLATPIESTNIKICGVNETESGVQGKVKVKVESLVNSFSVDMSCLIVPQITGALPNFKVDMRCLEIPRNITLADPKFNLVGSIDMLIGADCFWNLLCVGQIKLGAGGPFLQKSKLGWIISGRIASEPHSSRNSGATICHFAKTDDVDRQLSRFWEIEECSVQKPLSIEEASCEEHFIKTFTRNAHGGFVVAMPMKETPDKLGDSYCAAMKQFLALERKFQRDNVYYGLYREFIDEYRRLGHMTKVPQPDSAQCGYYLPHHGVLKPSSTTTKLRTVFNASAKSTSGYSLNDLLMVGPTIQCDLVTILLRFRKFESVLAADVEKMYRMVQVDPSQRCLLRILWRDSTEDDIEVYELNTVTYGTSSAPFLAIRCLYQLGIEVEKGSPLISNVIKNHFYVDDLLSGGDTIEETVLMANELVKVLKGGGFFLRKWVSNDATILQDIESLAKEDIVDLGSTQNCKTLGLSWNGRGDHFFYSIGDKFSPKITKRVVLSEIAQVFDPLGLLSCCIILVKIFLRDLWLEKIDWDDALSQHLHTRYLQIREDLRFLNDLKIERKLICKNAVRLELHVFSDASSCAIGSCAYVRSIDKNGNKFVKLLFAKSKVAPLKVQTIPRLELLAAVLSTRLVEKIVQAFDVYFDQVTCWTDSSIVLGWIKTPPHMLQVFVANRVAAIQEAANIHNWKHVRFLDNPADFVSRGVRPQELLKLQTYWSGPDWLHMDEPSWPESLAICQHDDLPEIKKVVLGHSLVVDPDVIKFSKYSDLTRLERIASFCLRFKNNCLKPKHERKLGPLSSREINYASLVLSRLSQHQTFPEDFSSLHKLHKVENKSKLTKLHPFLDEHGVIRVGGRLSNSDYLYTKKHPIVLCSKHAYTKLLFNREHKRLLHAGPQLLLSVVRGKYWPVSGRSLARKVFHECVTCFRNCPKLVSPVMGDLPRERVTPSPPFYRTGVDYAGPFQIKDKQGRGCKMIKSYVALFVCFATKALHLELVTDLTKEAFIAALKRFVGRRGKPAQIFSDNGTNFRGAHNELARLGQFLQENSNGLIEDIENRGISWSFIPANSPHFVGLWESGVKAVKGHLRLVAGNARLTFEHFYTLLVEIESVVNSRPMNPSNDPCDMSPLTPSHFLIGRALESVPDRDYIETPVNRLDHFQRVQQLKQHFWTRWSLEYVSELQQRLKWTTQRGELKLNDLVLVKDDNLPPLKWLLGRIVEVHPGKDGVIRVASIRTVNGIIKRSFSKICPLPKAENTDSSDCVAK